MVPPGNTAGEAADRLVTLLTSPDYRAHGPEALTLTCAILSDPTLYTSTVTERVYQRLAETTVSVFAETRVYGLRLPGAYLRGVPLTGAHLTGAELVGSNLQDCNLFGADLSGANLTDVEAGPATRFVGVTALGARFVAAYLRECDFESADLRGADFTGARMWMSNLTDTTMGGANLTGAEPLTRRDCPSAVVTWRRAQQSLGAGEANELRGEPIGRRHSESVTLAIL